jgi:hypothetical protein
MKGYLDKLSLTQVSQFKIFLLGFIQNTNILKSFDITKPINNKVFNIFTFAVDKFINLTVK